MLQAEPQQVSTLSWLLQSGGLPPLVLGLVFALIGIVFIIRPNRAASLILAFLSLVPAIFGLIAVYSAATAYAKMAASSTMPKPSEFAELTGLAMSSSFCGLLGTLLSVFIAVLAMSRANIPQQLQVNDSAVANNSGAVPSLMAEDCR